LCLVELRGFAPRSVSGYNQASTGLVRFNTGQKTGSLTKLSKKQTNDSLC
jgi:hypothetical protein